MNDRRGVAKLTKNRNLLVFLLAISCGALVANLYYAQPIIQYISDDLNMSETMSGLLTTLTQLGYGVGLFFLVPMADLFRVKKLVVILISGTILSLLFIMMATNGVFFLLFTMLLGVGACAAQILVPIAVRIAPSEETGKYVGRVMSGLLIGIMIARPLSIEIMNWFGWKMVFLLSFLILIGVLLLIMKFLPNFDAESSTLITYPSLIKSMVNLLKHTGPLKQRAFYHACIFATLSLYWTVLPIFLRTENFSNTEIALIGLVSIAGALLTPTFGHLGDKGYIYSLTIVAMLLVILSMLLLFFVHSHSILAIVLIIISGLCLDIGVSGNLVLGQKVIFSLDSSVRNRLNGLYMTIFFLGGAFGSWIGGYSYYSFNVEIAFMIGMVLPLIALVVHLSKYKKVYQGKEA